LKKAVEKKTVENCGLLYHRQIGGDKGSQSRDIALAHRLADEWKDRSRA